MLEENKIEGIISFEGKQKSISFPEDYKSLLNQILSLFGISKEMQPFLIINFKNIYGIDAKISSQEEYSDFLQKISDNKISNIISISFQQISKNKIQRYREDIYDKDDEEEDKDEIILNRGKMFSTIQKKQSGLFEDEFDINNILNESIENSKNDENNINNINNINNSDDNIFKNENNAKHYKNNNFRNDIAKSVFLPTISFPTHCNICQKFPIMRIMYFCNECQLFLCEECEKKLGYNHRHCYYKIRNKQQYQEAMNLEVQKNDLVIKNKIKKEKENAKTDKFKDKNEGLNGIFNSIIGFMTGSK